MINRTVLTLTLISAIVLLTDCRKEGCADPDSINYDSSAKFDDGSCQFEGEVLFWYGQTTSQDLVNNGAITLTFYVDNEIVGSTAANVFWTEAPKCVQRQDGWEYWSGTVNFNAASCLRFKLGQ